MDLVFSLFTSPCLFALLSKTFQLYFPVLLLSVSFPYVQGFVLFLGTFYVYCLLFSWLQYLISQRMLTYSTSSQQELIQDQSHYSRPLESISEQSRDAYLVGFAV